MSATRFETKEIAESFAKENDIVYAPVFEHVSYKAIHGLETGWYLISPWREYHKS